MKHVLFGFLLWGLGAISPLVAQVKVANPGFPPQETMKYGETVGSVTRPLEVSLTLKGDGPSARYEFRSVGADLEGLYRLDPVTLVSLSSETVTKALDANVRRTAEYRDLRIKAGPDDLPVTDMGSLPVVLRGFPWGQRSTAKITYVGSSTAGANSSFSLELAVVGKETITVAGRSWECWHATTGLGGALSLLMAKTDWWFAVDGAHPLVKTSGPSGGPGSPNRVLVLQSYQTGP